MTAALATLIMGILIGYLGQRSRLRFVSGYRNLVLTGDKQALLVPIGTLLGAVAGYYLCSAVGGALPEFLIFPEEIGGNPTLENILVAASCAITLGWIGTGVGGCPYRMHVLAAEGKGSPWYYLLGFYVGIPFFNQFIGPLLVSLSS